MGEGSGEDDDEVVTNSQDFANPSYGSTSQLPRVAFEEKSKYPPIDHDRLPPIGQKTPPPPYENGVQNGRYSATNEAFPKEESIDTVIAMDGLPKTNYLGRSI